MKALGIGTLFCLLFNFSYGEEVYYQHYFEAEGKIHILPGSQKMTELEYQTSILNQANNYLNSVCLELLQESDKELQSHCDQLESISQKDVTGLAVLLKKFRDEDCNNTFSKHSKEHVASCVEGAKKLPDHFQAENTRSIASTDEKLLYLGPFSLLNFVDQD